VELATARAYIVGVLPTAIVTMLLFQAAITEPPHYLSLLAQQVNKAQGQSEASEERGLVQETQARGYWVDSSTGLMWAAKDNGRDITWKNATRYCRDLRLAGYSDWRLPTVDELEGIYDGSGFNAPHPKDVILALAGRAKGGLLLTGNFVWSSNRVLDDRGHRTGYAWLFDFPHGNRWHEQLGYYGSKRALCVRSSAK
jgi:uncharacterized protein DUF1566